MIMIKFSRKVGGKKPPPFGDVANKIVVFVVHGAVGIISLMCG
jgi:hypothetical protein